MSTQKVILIEDCQEVADLVVGALENEGYRVFHAANGEDGLALVRKERPDLVILDIMLPGMDGIEVCRQLKWDAGTRTIPVIMVTARAEEVDVVLGLGVGADDYVPKPFRIRELLARVKTVMRRPALKPAEPGEQRIVRGGIVLDPTCHELQVEGSTIKLTPTEVRLLYCLASQPGVVFERGQLLSQISHHDADLTERNVDVHVRALRRKLGAHRDLIQTIRGVGYRFWSTDGAGP